MRLTNSEFLNQFFKLSQGATKSGQGSLEITFKRYNAAEETKLNPLACSKELLSERKVNTTKSNPEDSAESKTVPDETAVAKTQTGAKSSKKGDAKRDAKQSSQGSNPEASEESKESSPPVMSTLVHVKFGKKKISTVVYPDQIATFRDQFGTIFRAHVSSGLVPSGQKSRRLQKRIQASGKSAAAASTRTSTGGSAAAAAASPADAVATASSSKNSKK